ncbi:hypothetical protein [Acidithiobacillus sp. 'AMD consortium']|uniref:hypothetical protein n=1 Tax=Acidithiobacillus sp. 'AMD consortium' TaxID=2614801 RepID=UPI00178C4869|nr:hypothetical protein [Acidithiobacillus sp. 'AMD consortium']
MFTHSELLAYEEIRKQIRAAVESGQLVLNESSRIVAEQVLKEVIKQAPAKEHRH